MTYLYSITPTRLEAEEQSILRACQAQGIDHITLLAAVTGKLTDTPQRLAMCRQRLEAAGLRVSAMVFAIGHPAMGRFYDAQGRPPHPTRFYLGPRVLAGQGDDMLLPPNWQYAVNEHGNPVYCCACPNEAWLIDNQRLAAELAEVFDTIWYDDEFRLDGDQGAGAPHTSTAMCYCDACLARLAVRLGRNITREEIVAHPDLHEAWIEDKIDRLTFGFQQIVQACRAANPQVSVGLMVRWGGEERDGIDIHRLGPILGDKPLLRAGEGHFGDAEYARPVSQVMEYLACAYHVSWFPRQASVLSETTYFAPMPRHAVVKKAALALAAGASELAYCPCVDGFVSYQWFIEHDQALLARCAEAFADKSALYRPIRLVRTSAAGRGDARPEKRVHDRQYFPLFSLAGLNCTVLRQGSWRDPGGPLAITGRAAWDCALDDSEPLIIDGTALLEGTRLNAVLGIRHVRVADAGRVEVDGPFEQEGLLLRRGNIWIIPYVWHALLPERMPDVLRAIRRTLGPVVSSAYVEGDLDVMVVHHRGDQADALMLVNLVGQTRRVRVHLPDDRPTLTEWQGKAIDPHQVLGPHEIRLLQGR